MGGKREEEERRSGERRSRNSKRSANNVSVRRRSERIAANERLTISAGFFTHGVVSQVAKKSVPATSAEQAATRAGSQRRQILNEDLHGLLRRSDPQTAVKSGYYPNASNYYLSLLRSEQCAPKVANGSFCADLRAQIEAPRARRSASDLIHRIREEARRLSGPATLKRTAAMSSVHKRPVPTDDNDGGGAEECPIRLVPQSEWVYSTPVKQTEKKFVFEDDSAKFLPAVFHTSKKTKVLYDIKNEFVQHVNLGRYKGGENVPIDKRFLKTICESSVDQADSTVPQAKKKKANDCEKENRGFEFVAPQPPVAVPDEYNMFLAKNAEESVDISEVIERGTEQRHPCSPALFHFAENRNSEGRKFNFEQCRSALPTESFYSRDKSNTLQEKAVPLNYQHQLLLATERPCKTTKKVERRHLLKAKCLSFDSATPPSGDSKPGFEPKKLMTRWECFEYDYLDQFEKEQQGRAAVPSTTGGDAPHTITSGALNEPPELPPFASSSSFLPTWKFYPRCNFDPE